MLLTLQDRHGVRWALLSEVASITPAYPQRWRVVLVSGEVAYLLSPPPPGPWVRLQDSWVAPKHLKRVKKGWVDPAGFFFPGKEKLPEPPEWEPDGELDYEVLWLKRKGQQRWWCTDDGEVECDLSWKEALETFPELILVQGDLAANRSRFRRIRDDKNEARITLDNDLEIRVSETIAKGGLAAKLGLDHVGAIDVSNAPPTLFRVREYPYELARASAEQLRSEFRDAAELALNLVWQTAQYERDRVVHDYGRDIQSYFQHPITSTLTRAGYALKPEVFKREVLRFLIEDLDVLTFQQLGFVAPEKRCWQVGSKHPEVVLALVEGREMKEVGATLATQMGISFFKIPYAEGPFHREFFLRELAAAVQRPVRWLAWVHFSPEGWHDVDLIREVAERRGLESVGKTGYLVRPECFSEGELQKISESVKDLNTPMGQQWLTKSGGHAVALKAFRLLPAERVEKRLRQLLSSVPQSEPVPQPPPPDPPRHLALQDNQSVRWVSYEQIAALMPAFPKRWRADLADGSIAYHPGPIPTTHAWKRLHQGWARPELLRRDGAEWVDPPQFRFPYQDLPAAPPPRQPIQELPGLPCAPDRIVSLEQRGQDVFWQTDSGEVTSELSLPQAARCHPAMLRVNRYLFVNRHRLDRLFVKDAGTSLLLDSGRSIRIRSRNIAELARQLNLSLPLFADDRLFRFWLRDFPYELARAPGLDLRANFGSAVELIANVLFQAYTYRLIQGPTYGDTIRGFFYFPLAPMLERAGFLGRRRFSDQLEKYFALYRKTLHRFVYRYRLFSYRQFGFTPQKGYHSIGAVRPDILLVVEKGGIPEEFARRLAQAHGVTLVLLEGTPSLMATEFLIDDLQKVYRGPLQVIAYVDFDCYGWIIAEAFLKQLAFYGYSTSSMSHIVTPKCYTAAELELFARLIPLTTPGIATKVVRWIAGGGGIDGKAMGLHIDTLQPYERVRQRFEELLACL